MTLQTKTVIEPDLVEVLANLKLDIFSSLNCVKVGEIQSFNPSTKTAQVQILFKRVFQYGVTQSMPLLVDVPVFTLQGGGGSIQFPITRGDQCIVLFSDRRLDEWFQNGSEAAPGDARMHDLSDGIALVGVNALNSSLPAYLTDRVAMLYKGSQVQLNATGIKCIATGSAELDLDTLVSIKNGTTSLLTLMTNFITMLEGLTIQDNEGGAILPLTPAAITLLENFKAQFALLLK